MISEKYAKEFCKDDITKIENYEKAISDPTQTWHCHHRLELTLDGEYAHSIEDLKRLDMYYNRPYFELIFLQGPEHRHLHGKTRSAETIAKISEAKKSTTLSAEHRAHIRESGKKRRVHKDIDVRQNEDYTTYQREYQRKYRLAHPHYYRDRARQKKESKIVSPNK
jgi:hypothetical protein